MMRIVLATACCRYGSGGLVIKLNFCSDFEHKVWSLFWSWSSGKIWSRSLFSILLLMFWSGNEVESWSRFWSQVWSIYWILSLVEMLMFCWDFEVEAWLRFWTLETKAVEFKLNTWLGHLCLWHCLWNMSEWIFERQMSQRFNCAIQVVHWSIVVTTKLEAAQLVLRWFILSSWLYHLYCVKSILMKTFETQNTAFCS